MLPLRVDCSRTWAAGVVEAVPGVPPSTIPAQLDEPRPDLIWRSVDRDGHRRAAFTARDQIGTGIRPGNFLIGRAPAHQPRAYPGSVDDSCRPGDTDDLASRRHTRSLGEVCQALQGTTFPRRPPLESALIGSPAVAGSTRLADHPPGPATSFDAEPRASRPPTPWSSNRGRGRQGHCPGNPQRQRRTSRAVRTWTYAARRRGPLPGPGAGYEPSRRHREDHANHRRSPGTRSVHKPPRGMTISPIRSDHRTGCTRAGHALVQNLRRGH